MEYPLYIAGQNVGRAICRQEDGRIRITATAPFLNDGVYKAYLVDTNDQRLPVGIMAPKKDTMEVSRIYWPADIDKLAEPISAIAEMTLKFGEQRADLPDKENYKPDARADTSWQPEPEPQRFFSDPLLASRWSGIKNVLTKKEKNGILLAVEFKENEPFALLPMFCLGKPDIINGKKSLVFRINSAGYPVPVG